MIKPVILSVMLTTMATHSAMATETGHSSGLSLSGSAALTTDYRFRGLSQSRNDPAVQGTFVLSHDSGLYGGIFAANTDFGGSTSPHFEFTSYIGYNTALNWSEKVKPTLDLSYNRFSYPGWSDWAWHEFSARLTFNDIFLGKDSLLTNINYSDDYIGFAGDAWNFTLGYSVPLAETGFGLTSSIGYSIIQDKGALIDVDADNYIDWKLGVNYQFKTLEGLTAELSAVGTNLNTDQLSKSEKRTVANGAIFSLTKAF